MKTRMNSMKKFAGFLLMAGLASFGLFGTVSAQTAPIDLTAPSCLSFASNMGIGTSSGSVVALQTFLNSRGYMSYASTGYFGPITYAAVVKFQSAYAIPNTGFVGPLTRAEIAALSCGNVPPAQGPVKIYNISPNPTSIGTSVTVTGFGFTPTDNIVFFAGGAISGIPSSGGIAIACTTDPSCIPGIRQSLTFTVPTAIGPYCTPGMACPMYARLITAGTYPLYVQNANGTSNTVTLTISSGTTGAPLAISGIDAPNSLPIGTTGTWTIHAIAGTSSTLHYSVSWGDQAEPLTSNIMIPASASTQSSTTFTHSYAIAGTYTPTFTVSDDFGHSVSTSSTIVVTPLY